MTKQFTASEVRESAIAVASRDMEYEAEMLRTYADRLEADEKGVPFTWVLEFNDPDPQVDFSEGSECPKGWQGRAFPLYTRP